MMPTLLSLIQLPDLGWVAVGAVVIAALAVWGGSFLLREMREVRANLADEIGRQLDAAKQAQAVQVQSPLVVTPHQQFATKEDHDALQAKMEDEFKRERSSRKAIYEKVEAQGQAIARLQTETTQQTRQLGSLDNKMDQVLMRLPRANG